MELSSKVEDVIFGKTCRPETVKATQGLNLCLLSTVCELRTIFQSPVDLVTGGKTVRCARISWKGKGSARTYLGLSLTLFLAVRELGAYGAVQPWYGGNRG